jgi:hypothetical protein
VRAKDIRLAPISASAANRIVRKLHYSGKIVQNSQIHFGVFVGDECLGALQFGPSTVKRNILPLVTGTKWNECIELNRMALSDRLPRNSESRSIAMSMRLLRKHYPHLKWVISFADACQCGDGAIYRASGFVLTGMKRNDQLVQLPDGEIVHWITLWTSRQNYVLKLTNGKGSLPAFIKATGARRLVGYQLRYVYFLDESYRERLAVPTISFDEIEARGASMYRGRTKPSSEATGFQPGEDGAIPIRALHSPDEL